ARPLPTLEQPPQQHRENLVRVDEAPVFRYSADAVGVAVCRKAGVAPFFNYNLAQLLNVRLDGLGIDSRKQRIQLLANRHVADAAILEDAGENAAPRAIHGVDRDVEPGLGDEIEIGEAADRLDVVGLQIDLVDPGFRFPRRKRLIEFALDDLHNGGG